MSKEDDFFAAIREDDLESVSVLLNENPALANARIGGDSTLLNNQVWENLQIIDLPAGDQRDGTALHYAAFKGDVELAKLLILHGADVNAIAYENNHEMTTPVILAAWEGGIDVLRVL